MSSEEYLASPFHTYYVDVVPLCFDIHVNEPLNVSHPIPDIYQTLTQCWFDVKRVHLPLCKVADAPFHIQGDDLIIIFFLKYKYFSSFEAGKCVINSNIKLIKNGKINSVEARFTYTIPRLFSNF